MQRVALVVVLALVAVVVAQPPTCNMIQCTVDADCSDQLDCNLCIGGVCGSGCQGNCTADRNCRDPNCQFCYKGYCGNSPMHLCGGACQTNIDCNQMPDNHCMICLGGVCTADCGMPCANDTECLGATCQKCILGKCVQGSHQCNQQCSTNLDCSQSSYCSLCISGQCGAGCSQPCSNNTQCIDGPCKYCKQPPGSSQGFCSNSPPETCGGHCGTNADCDATPGRCNQCYFNTCTSTCGSQCEYDSDCGVQGCQSCQNSTCTYSSRL